MPCAPSRISNPESWTIDYPQGPLPQIQSARPREEVLCTSCCPPDCFMSGETPRFKMHTREPPSLFSN